MKVLDGQSKKNRYHYAKLANLENLAMTTKSIASTEAQNNFGQILNDVIQHHTRYVIKRRNAPQAIILSLSDLEKMLTSSAEQQKMILLVRELTPVFDLGEPITADSVL